MRTMVLPVIGIVVEGRHQLEILYPSLSEVVDVACLVVGIVHTMPVD
jgi:hypothetical protein